MVEVLHDPGGLGHRVDQIWAWVTVHGGDDEAIIGILYPGIGAMPAVSATESIAREKFRPHVQRVVNMSDKPAKLVRFDNMTVEEVIEPWTDDKPAAGSS